MMPEIERFQILMIGSGEAGKHLTWTMAQAGHRTAVVERKYIGGSCPNIACLPSKNVIRSAKANWFARHGSEYGIQTGPVSTDMRGVLNRKRKMVEAEVQCHLDRFKANGAELVRGEARFGSAVTVIERGPQVAAAEDPDIAQALVGNFAAEGIEVLLETHVGEVKGLSGQKVRLRIENGHGEQTIEGADLLVATGRTPNT